MKEVDCPVCKGEGQLEIATTAGEVRRDADGNSFYKKCWRCHGQGTLKVPDDYEDDEIDDRRGTDDFRKEDELEKGVME